MAQQDALGFLESQIAFIERDVYRVKYPDIQYPMLVPVDTRAPEWARSITHYSMDGVGQASWFAANSQDMPFADVTRDQHNVGVEMAAIGYRYTIEELSQAMMVPGVNLTSERAEQARRSCEEYIDNIVTRGDTTKGWDGLINRATATSAANATTGQVVLVSASGSGAARYWSAKSPDEIIRDINDLLSGVYVDSRQVEMADTLLLPVAAFTDLASRRLSDVATTVMRFIEESNIYTAVTGMPLMIRTMRGLEDAGAGNVGRAIAYKRDPSVLRLHMPMPHRFLQPMQKGPLMYEVPGIFRLGGLEIRRPGAIRYMDGITA